MSIARKPQILFVHNGLQRFVEFDLRLLRERYSVEELHLTSARDAALRAVQTVQNVRRADLVFCWFASWHSLLPVLFARQARKPVIVVVGGYDTANLPEAGYGSQRGGLRRILSRAVMNNATRLFVNSESALAELNRNVGSVANRAVVAYHAVETTEIDANTLLQDKHQQALTVGGVWHENLLRKGLLPFVQASRSLPDVPFIHAGRWSDGSIETLRQAGGANVTFRGFVSENELQTLYLQSKVYVQASLHEGFGLSVAEAMSCGCIPVVTRAGALPEVVGDIGVYAESNRPDDLAKAIQTALAMEPEAGLKARERVLEKFTVEQRRRIMFRLVESLLQQAG